MSSLKNRTRPEFGGKSPVIALKSVVLPAPFAPITARRSPAATDIDTSSIAVSAPNRRVTPSRTRASPEASGAIAGAARRLETVAMVVSESASPTPTLPHRGEGEGESACYGQFGTSREPIWNSSFFIPSIWSTLSTLRSTLL